jgi:hypothetical protein
VAGVYRVALTSLRVKRRSKSGALPSIGFGDVSNGAINAPRARALKAIVQNLWISRRRSRQSKLLQVFTCSKSDIL